MPDQVPLDLNLSAYPIIIETVKDIMLVLGEIGTGIRACHSRLQEAHPLHLMSWGTILDGYPPE